MDDKQPNAAWPTSEFLYRAADRSFQTELDRRASLMRMASGLLAGIAIIVVAFLAFVGLVAGAYVSTGLTPLLIISCAVPAAPLLTSLVLAAVAHFGFSFPALDNPRHYSNVVRNRGHLGEGSQAALEYADQLEKPYATLQKGNRAIRGVLNAALICLLVAIGLTVAFIIVGICAVHI